MGRTIGVIAVGLLAGIAGTYVSKHVSIQVDLGQPPAVPAAPEPWRLPASVTDREVRGIPADGEVRQAVAMRPAAMMARADEVKKPAPVKITSVADTLGSLTLSWPANTGPVLLAGGESNTITLKLDRSPLTAPEEKLLVAVGDGKFEEIGKGAAAGFILTATAKTLDVPLKNLPAGRDGVRFRILASNGDDDANRSEISEIVLVRPAPSERDANPVTAVGTINSPFLKDFTPLSATAAEVFGGYLRVRFKSVEQPSEFQYFVIPGAGGAPVPVAGTTKPINPNTGEWEALLDMGQRTQGTAFNVVIRVAATKGHYYASPPVACAAKAVTTPDAPAFAKVPYPDAKAEDDKAAEPVYLAKTVPPSLAVTPPKNTQLLLLFLGTGTAPVAVKPVPADGAPVTFDALPKLGDGDHLFAVAGSNGKEMGPTAKITIRVRSAGPKAVSANAPGFGTGGGTDKITVQFTGEKLTDSAKLKANYEIAMTGVASRSDLSVTPESYDPASRIVTLVAKGVVAGEYTLTVKNDIVDEFGNRLVGPKALTEADPATFVLAAAAVAPPLPSQSVGITLQTGPNVTFPEYTKFRQLEDGFNPSDRVETRVVRLYYNRDAGRVAQIVNRDVKAYNASTVDVRRRAADRSRDEANKVTDERLRQEREAVRLAGEARQAEKELQAAMAKAADSRAKTDRSAASVGLLEDQVKVAERDLARALAAAAPLVAAEDTVAPVRARATLLANQLAAEQAAYQYNAAQLAQDEKAARDKQAYAKAQYDNAINVLDRASGTLRLLNAKSPPPDRAIMDRAEADLKAAAGDADANKAILTDFETRLATARAAALAEKQKLAALEQALAQAQKALAAAEAEQKTTTEPQLLAEQQRQQVAALQRQVTAARAAAAAGDTAEPQLQASVAAARERVAAARSKEVQATAAWQAKEQEELRAKEDQFRREVAAARENPDIYAFGKPNSVDPVEQCSISVVGEGLIQIRGPIKGLNIIRIMINQLDAPVGQVRIGVHSVQVNGERGDRMERVVANIQRYTDHARFLTAQSSQMLRKAVTAVASRKAEEAAAQLGAGCAQADRDRKYMYSFYGKDFMDELADLDSEFLHSGNKLLSLHSMDTTSLSAALFQMSLAKTSIRAEILQEFQSLIARDLPRAEMDYYMAGLTGHKCEACFDKKHYTLGCGPKFLSLTGYFNGEVAGEDTLTPIQREVVRLAQIFKTRMITEIQLKQRVMERSLLEDRVGDYLKELREAKGKEDAAKKSLDEYMNKLQDAIAQSNRGTGDLILELQDVSADVDDLLNTVKFVSDMADIRSKQGAIPKKGGAAGNGVINPDNPMPKDTPQPPGPSAPSSDRQNPLEDLKKKDEPSKTTRRGPLNLNVLRGEGTEVTVDFSKQPATKDAILSQARFLDDFVYHSEENRAVYERCRVKFAQIAANGILSAAQVKELAADLGTLSGVIRQELAKATASLQEIQRLLRSANPDTAKIVAMYFHFRESILAVLNRNGRLYARAIILFGRTDPAFRALNDATGDTDSARRKAELARRPLDEKKLLDLLVDELEDKHIELLEGTRAHTANVDNYIKAISTALEDDFNTQYYFPAFRRVREASRTWDVTLGQIETTTVLTNNRAFAKVDPAATFEFDLPKRNIAITEGFQAAKALMDEYGALTTDPTFLAAAKLYGGSPASALFGTGGGMSAVRNVLPGLSSASDETILAQAGPGRKEFGSAFEALIPDPAIYKFETGTGYEIRPVLSPDGQSVVFNFNYMYTTNVREPVRADEKHLGRVKRHFVHTDVQLSNYELREVSKYQVALKASRTGRGVQLLQDIPGVGVLFRPLPSQESSLQQNVIYAQTTIFPTLFDLMGLRYAPAVADLDPATDRNEEWVVRNRRREVEHRVYDVGASRVDDALRIPYGERRPDLYHGQWGSAYEHPNGYRGGGLKLRDSHLQEGYSPTDAFPASRYIPGRTPVPPGGAGYGYGPTVLGEHPLPHPGFAAPITGNNPASVANPSTGISGPSGYTGPPRGVSAIPTSFPRDGITTVTPAGQKLGTPRPVTPPSVFDSAPPPPGAGR